MGSNTSGSLGQKHTFSELPLPAFTNLFKYRHGKSIYDERRTSDVEFIQLIVSWRVIRWFQILGRSKRNSHDWNKSTELLVETIEPIAFA